MIDGVTDDPLPDDGGSWYAVRSLFRTGDRVDLGEGAGSYEERITVWRARSPEEALERAAAEAGEYADFAGTTYLAGFGQAYHLADAPPRDGVEVFSLVRDSDLAPEPYVGRFFATGREREL
jgi:hypothetical protein